ncbi:MAG TPA: GRP family sugar transporter [Candidatus Nanoarchaeia archaeon]|nr:GRP family sugar transporter [Candidatus Nanoarchaeia archaeon]
MLWFIFSILTALFTTLREVISKKLLKNVDEYVASWSLSFFAALFLSPYLFFADVPVLGRHFWLALIYTGISVSITNLLMMKALKNSDLSKVSPIVAFSPLFLLFLSPLILGEFPTTYGLIGVILIVVGSYLLNLKKMAIGYFYPLKSLFKEKGTRMMLIVAFLWAIGSTIDKIGVQNSSPFFWAMSTNLVSSMILLPIMLHQSSNSKVEIINNIWSLAPVGFFLAIASFFQMTAITLTKVVYVISIKRISVIMSVISGWIIFKEDGIKERLIASVIMVLGVIFILLG